MVGRLLSYWEGNSSGAMLNFGRVSIAKLLSAQYQNPSMQPKRRWGRRHKHFDYPYKTVLDKSPMELWERISPWFGYFPPKQNVYPEKDTLRTKTTNKTILPNKFGVGNWLMVATHLKNMLVKMGSSSPRFGVKIKTHLKPPPRKSLDV